MARKSRKNMPVAVAEPTDNLTAKAVLSMDKEAKPYQVGIYARLSFESEANKERDTVDTQIAYIREFINSQDDMVEVEVYADISVTGTTFERPEFDRMIQDIRAGRINTVITRDLSRLGRNYVEAGNYIECIFPVLQVRYISVNDNYDSANSFGSTGGMSVALKNLVNALYCKDASKKVRAAKAVLAKQGKYIAAFAPFGYQKSEDDKHMLVPDPVTAPVVQLIFELAIKGMKYTEIANYLNNNGYDSIFEYYQKIGVKRGILVSTCGVPVQ